MARASRPWKARPSPPPSCSWQAFVFQGLGTANLTGIRELGSEMAGRSNTSYVPGAEGMRVEGQALLGAQASEPLAVCLTFDTSKLSSEHTVRVLVGSSQQEVTAGVSGPAAWPEETAPPIALSLPAHWEAQV
ncbi:hypothetical protein AGIG_G23441 [Arapaima gigas]